MAVTPSFSVASVKGLMHAPEAVVHGCGLPTGSWLTGTLGFVIVTLLLQALITSPTSTVFPRMLAPFNRTFPMMKIPLLSGWSGGVVGWLGWLATSLPLSV